jgi:hypothetical protein
MLLALMDTLRAVTLDEIRIDGGTQPRAAISEETVNDYATAMSEGAQLPPMVLFFDGAAYWLADGFHRYHAARKLGMDAVNVTVNAGTRRDAVLYAVGANQAHGLRRTNDDKRKAVKTLLEDEEWSKWNKSEIARRCNVSTELVLSVHRESLPHLPETASEPTAKKYITKHGTEATMNTEQIGRKKEPLPAEDAPKFKSRVAVQQRRDQMRTMAASGYSSAQIAAALGLSDVGCRVTLKREGIEVPGDATKGLHRHDSTRIVQHIVMDAENLTADVNLVVFADLDSAQFGVWIDSLRASRKQLDSFIQRLLKEQQKHVSAA